jgi:hypothetical protein
MAGQAPTRQGMLLFAGLQGRLGNRECGHCDCRKLTYFSQPFEHLFACHIWLKPSEVFEQDHREPGK